MMSKKEREEKNFNKRKIFWDAIRGVSFDFDANKYNIKTFCDEFCKRLQTFRDKCASTMATCKGRATIQHFKSIIKGIDTLYNSVNTICLNFFSEESFEKSIPDINMLSKILIKTSKAHFPHLINRSTLDFDLTRQEFKRLSEELTSCKNILVALTNENTVIILLKDLKDQKKRDTLINQGELKLDYHLIFYKFSGNTLRLTLGNVTVNHWLLQQIINILKIFNKIKNFSDLIKKLEGIIIELATHSDSNEEIICANCGADMKYIDDVISPDLNHGCNDRLCKNCLIKASANGYKCPKCRRKLDEYWVRGHIKEMSS